MLPLGTATVPTPLLICAEVAFVVVHDSVVFCPALIVVGLAERVAVGAGDEPDPLPPDPEPLDPFDPADDVPPPQPASKKREEMVRKERSTNARLLTG